MGGSKREPLSTRVDESFKQRVQEFADRQGWSRSEAVREAVAVGMQIIEEGREPDELEARLQELEEENERLQERIDDLRKTPRHRQLIRRGHQAGGAGVIGVVVLFVWAFLASTLGSSYDLIGQGSAAVILLATVFAISFYINAAVVWVRSSEDVRGDIEERIRGILPSVREALP